MIFTTSRYIRSGYVTTVSEELRYEGKWWITSIEAAVAGTLSITPKGIWLRLIESFDNTKKTPDRLSNYDIILGIQYQGYRFTLEGCKEIQNQSGSVYNTQVFYVETVYGGTHVENTSDLKFKMYDIRYTYLSDWLRNPGFRSPQKREDGYYLEYKDFIEIESDLPNASIEIKSSVSWGRQNFGYDVQLKILDIVRVRCQLPTSIKDITQEILDPVQEFIILATTRPSSITSLSAKRSDSEDEDNVTIFTQTPYPVQERVSLFNRGIVLFHAKDILEKPEFYLNRWFELKKEMRDVFQIFIDAHYDPELLISNKFLNITQALESYNRIRYGNTPTKKQRQKEKVFKDRIRELVEKTYSLVDALIPNPERFSIWVKETRNYLVHRDMVEKDYLAEEENLELLFYTLLWLLRVSCLLEIGFSNEQCAAFLARNNGFEDICKAVQLRAPWIHKTD